MISSSALLRCSISSLFFFLHLCFFIRILYFSNSTQNSTKSRMYAQSIYPCCWTWNTLWSVTHSSAHWQAIRVALSMKWEQPLVRTYMSMFILYTCSCMCMCMCMCVCMCVCLWNMAHDKCVCGWICSFQKYIISIFYSFLASPLVYRLSLLVFIS